METPFNNLAIHLALAYVPLAKMLMEGFLVITYREHMSGWKLQKALSFGPPDIVGIHAVAAQSNRTQVVNPELDRSKHYPGN